MFRFLIYICLLLQTSFALAQKSESNSIVDSTIEEATTQILLRHLKAERFQVIATAVLNEGSENKNILIPGFNRDISTLYLSMDRIRPLLKSVKIEVLIDEKYEPAAKKRLGEILKRKLRLKGSDSVTFSNLNLPIPSAAVEDNLKKTEQQLSDITSRYEKLKLENDEKNQKILELKKTEVDNKSSDKDKAPKLDGLTKWSPLYLPLALMLAGLGLAIASMRSQSDSSRRLADAFNQIAKSLPKPSDRNDRIAVETVPNQDRGNLQLAAGNSQASPEAILAQRQRIFEIQSELDTSFLGEGRNFIIQHISKIIPINATRAVLLMEALGKENAAKIFDALDFDSQAAIIATIRTMNVDGNKYETMIQMAEELKTLLIISNMELGQNTRDPQITSAVSRLRDSQLVEVCKALPKDALGRFLNSVTPLAIANMLKKSSDPDLNAEIINILPELPLYARKNKDDPIILDVIRGLDTEEDREARPFFSFYKELLESTDDSVADQISALLTGNKLRDYLAQNVVKLSMFFRLADELFEEILDGLAIKDIAVLMKHSNDEQQSRINKSLSGQRSELVAEELGFIKEQSMRTTQPRFEALRTKLLDQLRQMQRDGVLAQSLEQDNTDASRAA